MGVPSAIRDEVLDKLLSGTAITTGQVTHISLHSAQPDATGSNEITGGGYAREAISFNAASAGSTSNAATVSFASLPTATVTHVGLWTAVSGGTFVWRGALDSSKSVTPGDTLEFAAGAVSVTTSGI